MKKSQMHIGNYIIVARKKYNELEVGQIIKKHLFSVDVAPIPENYGKTITIEKCEESVKSITRIRYHDVCCLYVLDLEQYSTLKSIPITASRVI